MLFFECMCQIKFYIVYICSVITLDDIKETSLKIIKYKDTQNVLKRGLKSIQHARRQNGSQPSWFRYEQLFIKGSLCEGYISFLYVLYVYIQFINFQRQGVSHNIIRLVFVQMRSINLHDIFLQA